MSATTNDAPEVKRAKHGRSPAYPGIDLQSAIAKAKALYEREGKYAAPMPSAFTAWGYGAKSSSGREVRAALRYFGLISIDGDGENGKVKLTDKALRVLLDERDDETEKNTIIRELALTPAIHKKIVERYPDGIRSDATVKHFLVFEEGYNETAASDLVAEFKETAAFAGLFQPDLVSVIDPVAKGKIDEAIDAQVNDLVQIELNGALQHEKPVRVRAVQVDENGGKWVFVDGSQTGIPMEQIVIQGKATPPTGAAKLPPIFAEGIATLPEEREWLRGPLSKNSSYRLIVSGDLGPKEIGKLIKLLTAQKAVLSDDDDEADQ